MDHRWPVSRPWVLLARIGDDEWWCARVTEEFVLSFWKWYQIFYSRLNKVVVWIDSNLFLSKFPNFLVWTSFAIISLNICGQKGKFYANHLFRKKTHRFFHQKPSASLGETLVAQCAKAGRCGIWRHRFCWPGPIVFGYIGSMCHSMVGASCCIISFWGKHKQLLSWEVSWRGHSLYFDDWGGRTQKEYVLSVSCPPKRIMSKFGGGLYWRWYAEGFNC